MKLSGPAKRMICFHLAALPLLAGGAAVFYRSWAFLPFAGGALLGTALNIAKVALLDRAVKKLAGMDAAKAGGYTFLQSLLRFLLTGGVLVLAAWVPFVSLWGAAASILVYQAALYSMNWLSKKTKKAGDADELQQ